MTTPLGSQSLYDDVKVCHMFLRHLCVFLLVTLLPAAHPSWLNSPASERTLASSALDVRSGKQLLLASVVRRQATCARLLATVEYYKAVLMYTHTHTWCFHVTPTICLLLGEFFVSAPRVFSRRVYASFGPCYSSSGIHAAFMLW